jgi:hypothetical protein
VNLPAYEKFAQKLVDILDTVTEKKTDIFTINEPVNPVGGYEMRDSKYDVMGAVFSANIYGSNPRGYEESIKLTNLVDLGSGVSQLDFFQNRPGSSAKVNPGMIFLVNTTRNELGDRTNWRCFEVNTKPKLTNGIRVDVSFLDSRGREVTRDYVEMKPMVPGLSFFKNQPIPCVFISPFTILKGQVSNRKIKSFSHLTLTRSLKTTVDELKSMASIRCTASAVRLPQE